MKFTFLLKMHQLAAETLGGIFYCRGRHNCSSCRSAPPNLMVAATAAVAANVSGVLYAPNLEPEILFPAFILLASGDGNIGSFGLEGRPLLSTISGGRVPPPPPLCRRLWIINLVVVVVVLLLLLPARITSACTDQCRRRRRGCWGWGCGECSPLRSSLPTEVF